MATGATQPAGAVADAGGMTKSPRRPSHSNLASAGAALLAAALFLAMAGGGHAAELLLVIGEILLAIGYVRARRPAALVAVTMPLVLLAGGIWASELGRFEVISVVSATLAFTHFISGRVNILTRGLAGLAAFVNFAAASTLMLAHAIQAELWLVGWVLQGVFYVALAIDLYEQRATVRAPGRYAVHA